MVGATNFNCSARGPVRFDRYQHPRMAVGVECSNVPWVRYIQSVQCWFSLSSLHRSILSPYLLMWISYMLVCIFRLIYLLKSVTDHLCMKRTTYNSRSPPVTISTLLAFAVLCFFPPVRAANAVCELSWGWVRTFFLFEFCSDIVIT